MKKIFYILICITLFISCSEDQDISATTNATDKILSTPERVKSEVPRDRIVYNAFSKIETESLENLINLYKKDIRTAEQEYMTNLKNMWFAILKDKLLTEGTEEQKLFFINEQTAIENNLAFFNEFYTLLGNSKLLNKSDKESIANTFYKKNKIAINDVQWSNPEEKKKKESELIYFKRVFTNLVNTQK